MNYNDELQKCPFCGGIAEIYEYSDGSGHIECSRCGAKGGSWGTYNSSYYKELAINSWNRRVRN